MTEENLEYKRLQWECRRGMLELDVLLKPFLEEAYPALDDEDKARFRNLLTCEDPDLFAWFMDHAEPAPEHARMIGMILQRVRPA